jgi:hypothetical protein
MKQHYQQGQIIKGYFNGKVSDGWVVFSDSPVMFGTMPVRRLVLEKDGKKYQAHYNYSPK